MKVHRIAICAIWIWGAPVLASEDGGAASLGDAIQAAHVDNRLAVEELNNLRDRISAERAPLADELERLERDVREMRAEADRLRAIGRRSEADRAALVSEVEQRQEEHDFIFATLREYRRSLGTRLNTAEYDARADAFDVVDQQLDTAAQPTGLDEAAGYLLRLASAWNRRALGGYTVAGQCLDAEGVEHEGRFTIFGPLAYFTANDGETAGIAVTRINSARPALFSDLELDATAGINALARGEEASVPIDPTLGDALRIASARRSLLDHMRAGGATMIPLGFIAAAACVLIFWKLVSLRRIRTPTAEDLDRLVAYVRDDRLADARNAANELREPVSVVLLAGIDHRHARKEHLEEIMHERALACIPGLDRHLGMLAVLGGVAPLLGLLGTVTGMIHTFELVTVFGTGDAKLLSSGISEALVTTETGLVIAVPVLLIHAYLSRRVRTVVASLEQSVIGFMNRLHAVNGNVTRAKDGPHDS